MRYYDTKAWKKLRLRQLNKEPLCCMCKAIGYITPAEVVDHIEPHRGKHSKFYDESNLQSLCKQCHDRHKQRQEKRGVLVGNDLNGIPLDPSHHWKKGRGGSKV